jgi:DNA-binding NarL/FixJ family response regulator
MTIRIVIADDQPLMRAALRGCLAATPDVTVLGEATNGLEAVDVARRLLPDVVLMDIRMPLLDGIAATRQLTMTDSTTEDPSTPPTRVLILTTFDADDYVLAALRAGASGFLLKDATEEELVHAIRVVAHGEALLAPAVTRLLLDRYVHYLPPVAPAAASLLEGLTPRELMVLRLVCRGLSNSEMAGRLHLALSSVKSHISHLLTKLNCVDRVHLVILGYEIGLIHPGDATVSM